MVVADEMQLAFLFGLGSQDERVVSSLLTLFLLVFLGFIAHCVKVYA